GGKTYHALLQQDKEYDFFTVSNGKAQKTISKNGQNILPNFDTVKRNLNNKRVREIRDREKTIKKILQKTTKVK
ncbi:MAG: hypothetical protein ACK5LL_05760, partial [Suipraeoptans sp.]